MRIRTIKPEWLDDERIVCASPEARVLTIALILLADDHGRGRASLPVLAGRVFPGSANPREDASKALDELARLRFVVVYEVDGQSYYQVRNWAKHQRVDRPSKSQLPEPPDENSGFPQEIEPPANPRESSRGPDEPSSTDHGPGPGPGPWTGIVDRGAREPSADAEVSRVEPHAPPPPSSLGAILAASPVAQPPAPPTEAPSPCHDPALVEATIRAVRRLVHDLYVAQVGYSHDLNGKHVQRLTQTLGDVARTRGEALPVVVERAVRGFLDDPYWKTRRWPLNGLVSQAARYADPPKPEELEAADDGKREAKVASLRSKLSAAATDRALAASTNPGAVARIDESIAKMRGELARLEGAA